MILRSSSLLFNQVVRWRVTQALLCLVASLGFPALASAQYVAETQAGAEAIVLRPLTLIKVNDLDFGRIVASNRAGTVTLDPATGARTTTNGIIATGGTGQPAEFAGMGRYLQTVTLAISSNTIVLRRSGGPQTMTLNNFTINTTPQTTLSTTARTFRIGNPTGLFGFQVGGRLNVGANQAPGKYTGTFAVTIQYQ